MKKSRAPRLSRFHPLVSLVLMLIGANACVRSTDSPEGSQSHFVCVSSNDCEELGVDYECKSGLCRSSIEVADAAPTTTARGSNDAAYDAGLSALTYVGRWRVDRAGDSDAYDAFMILGSNVGRSCVADGKSATKFELSVEDDQIRLGPDDDGAGGVLRMSVDESHLQRTAVEKGITYVTQYVRFGGTLPDWCSEQLALIAGE